MKCKRCNQEYDKPDTNICGNCADDLRQEEMAEKAHQEFLSTLKVIYPKCKKINILGKVILDFHRSSEV